VTPGVGPPTVTVPTRPAGNRFGRLIAGDCEPLPPSLRHLGETCLGKGSPDVIPSGKDAAREGERERGEKKEIMG